MSRIALIGSNGQLGSDIVRCWPASALARRGDELVPLIHSDVEVTDQPRLRTVLGGIQPAIVINTAAFHQVDDCESEPEKAFEVNGLGVKYLAEVCDELGARLVHLSTDYVFDGESREPYKETDATRPISAYAISKLAGEHFLRYMLPNDHLIIRTSGLYGVAGASGKGGNFVELMLRLARAGRPITVVNDQVLSPSYTVDVAGTLLELLARNARGIYHITNAGECSWYDFAAKIFELTGVEAQLSPVSSPEYGAAALRPHYSVLSNEKLRELGLEQPRHWQEALNEYLQLKGHKKAAA